MGRIEAFAKSVSGIQRRRRRTVLLLRAFLLYTLIEISEAYGWHTAEKILVDFSLAFYGAIVLLAFIGLQLEGKRIRKVARETGQRRMNVARVLRKVEKES